MLCLYSVFKLNHDPISHYVAADFRWSILAKPVHVYGLYTMKHGINMQQYKLLLRQLQTVYDIICVHNIEKQRLYLNLLGRLPETIIQ